MMKRTGRSSIRVAALACALAALPARADLEDELEAIEKQNPSWDDLFLTICA